jgi:hypothetical protein
MRRTAGERAAVATRAWKPCKEVGSLAFRAFSILASVFKEIVTFDSERTCACVKLRKIQSI